MAVRLVVTFRVLPGKAQDFAQAFAPIIEEVHGEPGCEQYELFASLQDPDKLVLLERWTDQATLDAHLEENRRRGPSPTEPYRAAPGVLERYQA